jgi:hypothetical protein
MSHGGMHMPELLRGEELAGGLSRFIALLIVLATLGAALVGYQLAGAAKARDEADASAQRYAVRSMRAALRAQQSAQVAYGDFVTAQLERDRAAYAVQRELVDGQDRATHLDRALWNGLAATTERQTPASLRGAYGPAEDPYFPNRFFSHATWDGERLAALEDASNEDAARWSARVGVCAVILTLFAVALYLLGFSLTLPPDAKRWLALLGLGIALFAAGWALKTSLHRIHESTDRERLAAQSFASGRVGLLTAYTQDDYRRAARYFGEAIKIRRSFGRAYEQRAEALFLAASPQQSTTYRSIADPEAVRRAVADDEQARKLGFDTSRLLRDLGFEEYLLWRWYRGGRELERAIDDTRASIARNPAEPAASYDLGLELLAAGDETRSRQAYESALRKTIYSNPGKGTRRDDPSAEEQWVATALTDLTALSSARPDLAHEVDGMKELVAGSVASGSLTARSTAASLAGGKLAPTIRVFPRQVQLSGLRLRSYDPGRDHISIQWYVRSARKNDWAVLPSVSGPVRQQKASSAPSYVLVPAGACLPDGSYRAEIYLNDRRVFTGQRAVKRGGLEPAAAPNLGVQMCIPGSWSSHRRSIPGLLSAYVTPDGASGIYVLRVSPEGRLGLLAPHQRIEAVLGQLLPRLLPRFRRLSSTVRLEAGYFVGLPGEEAFESRYQGGWIEGGAGVAPDGEVLSAYVFAPRRATARTVFGSLVMG